MKTITPVPVHLSSQVRLMSWFSNPRTQNLSPTIAMYGMQHVKKAQLPNKSWVRAQDKLA